MFDKHVRIAITQPEKMWVAKSRGNQSSVFAEAKVDALKN